MASIKHPNVVAFKEAFYDVPSSSLCIVMEYADGDDMYNCITHKKKTEKRLFDEKTLWRYLIQMVTGLKAVHDLNIVH